MISFRDVVVRYPGAASSAVDVVSFDVPAGRITALAGPNGSGKSTLVRALIKRVAVRSGAITVDDRPLDEIGVAEIGRLAAVLPQREDTAFPLGVREYVSLGRFPHLGLWNASSPGDDRAVERSIGRA